MKVWRKQTTRTVNGKRERIESKRFYGTLTLSSGKRKHRPLTEERDTSETLLRRLQTAEDTKRANGADRYFDDRQRPLSEFLSEYEIYLASKGNTSDHVTLSIKRCRSVVDAIRAKTIGDLDSSRILKTLSDWRGRKRKPISATTSNHYVTSVKSFSRWLWQERKSPDDPLAGLRKLNAETDRKHVRRPLTDAEIENLLTSTLLCTKTYRGSDWQFTSTDRAMLYAIAAFTGLRANEIASLTKTSFDFEAMTWTIAAASSKNRKATTLPLAFALASRLRPWFATLKRNELFPGSWTDNRHRMAGKMLKRDLLRCGIDYRDDSGRVVDFHSLRHTFITSLAKRGVHPAKAQRLARHSTIALTMNVYTSLAVDDLRDAVADIGK